MSQKYAYIDSDYILSKMPEYTEAKEQLDKLADRWTKEIEKLYEVLTMKKEAFAREEVLLPTEERTKREEEIKKLETEAMQMDSVRLDNATPWCTSQSLDHLHLKTYLLHSLEAQ